MTGMVEAHLGHDGLKMFGDDRVYEEHTPRDAIAAYRAYGTNHPASKSDLIHWANSKAHRSDLLPTFAGFINYSERDFEQLLFWRVTEGTIDEIKFHGFPLSRMLELEDAILECLRVLWLAVDMGRGGAALKFRDELDLVCDIYLSRMPPSWQ